MGAEKYQSWRQITVEDVKAFLGFSILMGINVLPSIDDYWWRDKTLRYAPIADRITRDRFRYISRYLRFVDNSTLAPRGSPNYNRLGKVQPLIDRITGKFTELAVDEARIKFQGQSSLKQYMPLKPIKHRIKVWVLADSNNGYFSKLQVYTGKADSPEKALGPRVIKELTAHLHGKKHHVFFDNFFTNKELLEDLENDGIHSCGQARFPRSVEDRKAS